MKRRFAPLVIGGLTAASALVFAARAPGAPSFEIGGDRIDVKAKRVDVDLGTKTAVLEGDVELRRADLLVRCPRVDARFDDAPRVTWARARGGVDVETRGISAHAEEAEIDVAKKAIDLRGAVRLSRGTARIEAESASIDLSSQKVSLENVHGVIPAPSASVP